MTSIFVYGAHIALLRYSYICANLHCIEVFINNVLLIVEILTRDEASRQSRTCNMMGGGALRAKFKIQYSLSIAHHNTPLKPCYLDVQ